VGKVLILPFIVDIIVHSINNATSTGICVALKSWSRKVKINILQMIRHLQQLNTGWMDDTL